MQRIGEDRKIKKAELLCRMISDHQSMFAKYGFKHEDYNDEDHRRVGLLKKFFCLKSEYEINVLCFFIERKLSGDSVVKWNHIIKHFSLNLEGCVKMNACLEKLMKMQLVQPSDRYHERGNEYCLTRNCLNSILNYRPVLTRMVNRNDFMDGFIKEFDSLINDATVLPSVQTIENFNSILSEYHALPEIQWLNRYKLSPESLVIFFLTLRHHIFFRGSLNLEKILKYVADEPFEKYELEKELKSGAHELIKHNLLCFEVDFFITENLKLTSLVLDSLGSISKGLQNGNTRPFQPKLFTMISHNEIKEEKYIHDNQDLRLIERMLSVESYEKIRVTMPGLTILLSGAAGCGKTSFVSQLTRKTGRPLLVVNIAKILSSFVGESEKNLMKLFEEAECAYKSCGEKTPICLFDEAESLFYARNPTQRGAVEHMNNNMVSLLLQCLDKFNGILFCCSNFTVQDFDPAIARRFHQIVTVTAPHQDILQDIFRSRFPEFTEVQAKEFIEHYNQITPAEIELLKNKFQVQKIVDPEIDENSLLYQVAEQVTASKYRQQTQIGFRL